MILHVATRETFGGVAEDTLVFPASFGQRRIWFLEQLEDCRGAYNEPCAARLSGALDPRILGRALDEIARRHEILRTGFDIVEGEPMQVAATSVALPLRLLDLSSEPETEREARAAALARDEIRRPFDLSRGPLMRAALLRLAEADHILVLTMHHAITDGWSMAVLLRELSQLYAAFSAGAPSPLPELAIQYADYAAWQREALPADIVEREAAYWVARLRGAPGVLRLPIDRPRSVRQTFTGARHPVRVAPSVASELRALGRRQGASLYMVLLAAFQALLSRWTAETDVVVGTPVAGRIRAQTEPLIGLFLNTLAMRTDLSGDPTFAQLLRRARETTLGALAHQEIPFEVVVERLQPERSLRHTPIFQVLFALLDMPQRTLKLPGVTASPLFPDTGTSKLDLTLALVEDEYGGLEGWFEFNSDLFESVSIARLADDLGALLGLVVAEPERKLSALPPHEAGRAPQALAQERPSAFAEPSASGDGFVAPRNELEARLAAMWERLLGISPVGARDSFFALGGHSLLAVRLFAEIERELRVRLPLATLFEEATVEHLALAAAESGTSPWPILVPLQPRGSRPPLFCLHPLGGDVVVYRHFGRFLGDDQPVYAVQARGMDGTREPEKEMEAMVASYVDDIRGVQPTGPYHLAGFSSGGTIAFELARQLVERGEKVAVLAIIDEPAALEEYLAFDWRHHPRQFLVDLIEWLRDEATQATQVGPAAAARRIVDKVKRLRRRGKVLDPEATLRNVAAWIAGDESLLPTHQRRVIEAQYEAWTRYRRRPYPGRVTLFRSRRQPLLSSHDPTMGWGALARGGVEVRVVAGSHRSIFQEPDVRLLVEELGRALRNGRGA